MLTNNPDSDIAIIGMAGRFPGAKNLQEFWNNLCEGKESIRFFSKEELKATGIPENVLNDPNYIRACGFLENADMFDAEFFRIAHREAEITDPQQRLLLECAWTALEDASYGVNKSCPKSVGVYVGMGKNFYLWSEIMPYSRLVQTLGSYNLMLHNEKDFLATTISYKLNLQGPSLTVQTACSTSLASVHLACQSLLDGECDMALAGGVTIRVPLMSGYTYRPEGITSPDGHCRAFDSQAQGIVPGSGVGIVVLKKLSEAILDNDHIYCVIKATAMNNDGSDKLSYTAPSISGQSSAIAQAIYVAGISSNSIGYVEAHGTGTILGDPAEIQALKLAFQETANIVEENGSIDNEEISDDEKDQINCRQFCAVGSVKTNVGHLDVAAGICGLIKTSLILYHKTLVPSLNLSKENPLLKLEQSPFYIIKELKPWRFSKKFPRRAGVSSLGIGGTNIHAILEEYIPSAQDLTNKNNALTQEDISQLITISALTPFSLRQYCINFVQFLKQQTDNKNFGNICYTQNMGRSDFITRLFLVASNTKIAIEKLENIEIENIEKQETLSSINQKNINCNKQANKNFCFIFPGQGTQYIGMAQNIYENSKIFSETLDTCADLLERWLHYDIRNYIFTSDTLENQYKLQQTQYAQPILFSIEYSLAKLWQEWGISPQVLLGHSLGEYVAATLAGVFDLPDALYLIARRGYWMSQTSPGSMLFVGLSESEVLADIDAFEKNSKLISLAVINAPKRCVISGTKEVIQSFQKMYESRGVICQSLNTMQAFHSPLMEKILTNFQQEFSQIKLHPPQIPFLSNLTGTWINNNDVINPEYWSETLRQPIRFSQCLQTLLLEKDRIFLEVGPYMISAYRENFPQETLIYSSLESFKKHISEYSHLLQTLGLLWCQGAKIHWPQFYKDRKITSIYKRLSIPTYPFQQKRYWVNDKNRTEKSTDEINIIPKIYIPLWQQVLNISFLETTLTHSNLDFFVFDFRKIDLEKPLEYIENMCQHLLEISQSDEKKLEVFKNRILVLCSSVWQVEEKDTINPYQGLFLGWLRTMAREMPNLNIHILDIEINMSQEKASAIFQLFLKQNPSFSKNSFIYDFAIRGSKIWQRIWKPWEIESESKLQNLSTFRHKGVYLITGGLGGIGFVLANWLAKNFQAKVALLSRNPVSEERQAEIMKIMKDYDTEIITIFADVSDEIAMQKAVSSIIQKWEVIHGVIHAAGIADNTLLLRQNLQQAKKVWQPKVYGLKTLHHVLGHHHLDWIALFSSVTCLKGSVGQAAYSAANSVFDLVSQGNLFPEYSWKAPTITIHWDTWKEVGMAVKTEVPERFQEIRKQSLASGITNEEGCDIFKKVIELGLTNVVVSKRNWESDILSQNKICFTHNQVSSQEFRIEQLQVNIPLEKKERNLESRPSYISTEYIPPNNELEKKLAEIWRELLGSHIGRQDSFLEFGGDSLLALQMLTQVRDKMKIHCPLRDFFSNPTIAALAQHKKEDS